MVSKPAQADSAPAEPSFELALKELESIVEAMESGQLPLEELLAKYESGTRLAQFCQRQLAAADVRIQQLESTLAGDQLRPVSLAAVGAEPR